MNTRVRIPSAPQNKGMSRGPGVLETVLSWAVSSFIRGFDPPPFPQLLKTKIMLWTYSFIYLGCVLLGLGLSKISFRKKATKKEIAPVVDEILLIKTSNDRYRVKIINAKGTSYVTTSDSHTDFRKRVFPADINVVQERNCVYENSYGIGTEFKEEDLPNLKLVMAYYQQYKTLRVVSEEVIERIDLSPKQLAISVQEQDILSLVPQLIAAEKAGDKETVDQILDLMEPLIKL